MKDKLIKVLRIASYTVTVILIIFLFTALLFITLTNSRSNATILGYGFYSINSGSMEPTLMVDDVIIVKASTEGGVNYKVGDIIVYESFATESFGHLITHRITEIDENGRYITEGDNNNAPDSLPVYPSQVMGVMVGKIGGFNAFVRFIKSVLGFILLIVLPSRFLIGLEISHLLRLYGEYRHIKHTEEEDEKAEREKQIEELKQLKEQLEQERINAEKEKAELFQLKEELNVLKKGGEAIS
jgi:signal peptidase I